ncbi:tetratricopeptide repeat protein [Actinomadura luteofluorescens]|uniref:nSTAND1 domain-containing NTPase n=1 Tax=Actinomadura luteofluorescens TaxID=46163 RepID=UPI00349965A1
MNATTSSGPNRDRDPRDHPYPGLRAFTRAEGDVFFGREREAADLRSLWLANRLTVLFGQSGAGKSSLLNAGVIPGLPSEVDLLPVGRLAPAPISASASGHGDNPFTFALLSMWSPGSGADRLRSATLAEFFADRSPLLDEFGEPMTILAAIDQFEELFTASPQLWRHRDAFIADLSAALTASPQLRVLVSMREDALASLLPYESRLSPPPRRRMGIQALAPAQALRAVVEPLRSTDRSFAPGCAEKLIDEMRTVHAVGPDQPEPFLDEYIEPVQLQIVCSALWVALPEDVRVVTDAHVREYGDVDQTLSAFYAGAVADVARRFDVDERELRSWIERTFITELNTRGTAYEGAGEVGGMRIEIARALRDLHLLRVEHRLRARWYELQHDRLIAAIQQDNRGTEWGPEQDASMYLRAAQRAMVAGEFRDSMAWSRRAVDAAVHGGDQRNQAEAEFLLGQAAGMLGDEAASDLHHARAIELFEVLRDEPAVVRTTAGWGDVLLAKGRPDRSLELYEAAVRRAPSDRAALEGLANVLWRLGQLRAATDVYERILAESPGDVSALGARGQLMAELQQPQRAITDLERALAQSPDPDRLPDLRSARALALAQLGRHPEAASELQAAIDADPRSARTYLRGGRTTMLQGEFGQARRLLELHRQVGGQELYPYEAETAADLERRLSPAGP